MAGIPRLLVVTDPALMGDDPVATVRGLLAPARKPPAVVSPAVSGPRWMLQWRDKFSSTRETYTQLLALCASPGFGPRHAAGGGEELFVDRIVEEWDRAPARTDTTRFGSERSDPTRSNAARTGRAGSATPHTDPTRSRTAGSEPARSDRLVPKPSSVPPSIPVVVNDRVDLALALGHGVHLTEGSLPTRIARSLLPATALLGRSTHDLTGAVRAEAEGANYVVFGPVFDTPSKRRYGPPLGLDALAEVTAAVRIPVLAIGGISTNKIGDCLAHGAHGIAVIRAVWEAESPAEALEDLIGALTR